MHEGQGANYVYAETNNVVHCEDEDSPMLGKTVVLLWFDIEPEKPTSKLIVPMDQARNLRDDLNRILEEYDATD